MEVLAALPEACPRRCHQASCLGALWLGFRRLVFEVLHQQQAMGQVAHDFRPAFAVCAAQDKSVCVLAPPPPAEVWYLQVFQDKFWLHLFWDTKGTPKLQTAGPCFGVLSGSSGVFREAVLWLTAPWGVTEHRGFDVRLFVSDQGRVPLKQATEAMPIPAFPCWWKIAGDSWVSWWFYNLYFSKRTPMAMC